MQQMTPRQVQGLLEEYYDIPQKIQGILDEIRELKAEQESVCTPSVRLSGLPGGKGQHGDPTAATAITSDLLGYDKAIEGCCERIAELRERKNWLYVVLDMLDRTDRRILELAYMGPREQRKRAAWNRRPPWKAIAAEVGYSESATYDRARAAKQLLADLSAQTVLPGMSAKNPEFSGVFRSKVE